MRTVWHPVALSTVEHTVRQLPLSPRQIAAAISQLSDLDSGQGLSQPYLLEGCRSAIFPLLHIELVLRLTSGGIEVVHARPLPHP